MSKATSQLDALVSLAGHDLMMIVASPDTAPANKKLSIWKFLGMLPSNTHVMATLTVDGNSTFSGTNNLFAGNTTVHGVTTVRNLTVANNYMTIATAHATPANSTSTTIAAGTVFWDSGYIYVCTGANVVKRAALTTF